MHTPKLFGIPCWILPIAAGSVWLVSLLFMIITWAVKGSRHYQEMYPDQRFAYISNVGASRWGQPPFVVGSSAMVLMLCFTLGLERWYRRIGQLAHHSCRWGDAIWICSALLTLLGSCALVLLTIFDVRHHPSIHYPLVAVFIFGYIFAALLTCFERRLISLRHPSNKTARLSFNVKLVFIIIEIALVIVFGATMYQHCYGPSVVFEWIVGLSFTLYIWSFAVDFFATSHQNDIKHIPTKSHMSWDDEVGIRAPMRAKLGFGNMHYTQLP